MGCDAGTAVKMKVTIQSYESLVNTAQRNAPEALKFSTSTQLSQTESSVGHATDIGVLDVPLDVGDGAGPSRSRWRAFLSAIFFASSSGRRSPTIQSTRCCRVVATCRPWIRSLVFGPRVPRCVRPE